MSTSIVPRSAGIGLLVYVLATFVAFILSGAPGGDYSDAEVIGYIASSHAPVAFVVWYVAGLGALAWSCSVRACVGFRTSGSRCPRSPPSAPRSA
jgi:hypothetical protein